MILGPSGADSLEYDFLIPGPGTLAWHVDNSVADFFGPRADPGFGLNVNRARFGLQIDEADGLDDLGDFNSPFALGSATDPWFVGNHTHFGPETTPNTNTNDGGLSHVTIDVLSPAALDMGISIRADWRVPGWPVVAVAYRCPPWLMAR